MIEIPIQSESVDTPSESVLNKSNERYEKNFLEIDNMKLEKEVKKIETNSKK